MPPVCGTASPSSGEFLITDIVVGKRHIYNFNSDQWPPPPKRAHTAQRILQEVIWCFSKIVHVLFNLVELKVES